jgi:hypothetical protein
MEELTNADFFEEAPTSCSDCDIVVILTELKYKRRQYQSSTILPTLCVLVHKCYNIEVLLTIAYAWFLSSTAAVT